MEFRLFILLWAPQSWNSLKHWEQDGNTSWMGCQAIARNYAHTFTCSFKCRGKLDLWIWYDFNVFGRWDESRESRGNPYEHVENLWPTRQCESTWVKMCPINFSKYVMSMCYALQVKKQRKKNCPKWPPVVIILVYWVTIAIRGTEIVTVMTSPQP